MTGPNGERLCSACGEPNPVRANFCLVCGTQLDDEGDAGERRVLTVLFADLSGFTAFSEGSDVEDVRALAQEAADRLGDIVARYGGTVDKIIGDCVMAIFGAPTAHEDDPERAVRAALEMQACVQSESESFFGLALCVGVNTGEAMYSAVGPDGRYTVLGDTVNTAARLQGAAKKGEILVGAETHTATKDAIEYEAIDAIKAKNKSEPVEAWKAVGVPGAARAKAADIPLVGRQTEFARLWELYENARSQRSAYLASLVGPAGIGKSRLIRAVVDRAGDAHVLYGRCLDYGEGITYWPVIEMVKAAAGVVHDDGTEVVSRKLGALLESLGSDDLDELRTMAVALANLVAAPTTPRGTYSATEITKGELHWGIRRVFHLLARTKPVILAFEDLHWADPSLRSLVFSMLELTDDAPVLVIGSERPKDEPVVVTHRNHRVVELRPLDTEESRSMLSALIGTDETAELSGLLDDAAGNPLYLEEFVRMLADADIRDADGRISKEKVAALKIPSSLQALIGARLDRLSKAQKRVAGRAAVVGESFWPGAIAHLNGIDTDLDETLAELDEHEVVRPLERSMISGEREWAFRHALLRDVSYERMPKVERARLHARCGEWIAGLPGGDDELIEIVAYHLEQACLHAKGIASAEPPPITQAANALAKAAEKVGGRQGTREAVRYYTRSLELLDGSFPERATELELARAVMLLGAGAYDEAYESMERVAERSAEIGRQDLRCSASLTQAETDLVLGRVAAAREHLEEGYKLARESNDAPSSVRAAWSRATVSELEGDPDAAVEILRGAVALAEEIDHRERILTSYMRLGTQLFNGGKLAEAEAELQRCADLAQADGSLRHLSWVTACLGVVRTHRGPRRQAAEDLAHAAEWLDRTGDQYMRIQALIWQGELELADDDPRAAVRVLRIALAQAKGVAVSLVARATRSLVEALARQNRIAEARELLEEGRALEVEEDPYAQADIAMAGSFVAAAEGNDAEARQSSEISLALLIKQNASIDLGEQMLNRARVLERLGDTTGACDQFAQAREIFEAAGGTATVEDIDGKIERLSTQDLAPVIDVTRRLSTG